MEWGGLIKTVIRHKFVQNIPDIWPIPQLFLPLQRQTRNETIKTRNEESIKNHAVQRSGAFGTASSGSGVPPRLTEPTSSIYY